MSIVVNKVSPLMKLKTSVTTVAAAWYIGKVRCYETTLPFTGKPGVKVDLEDPTNPLE
jgi:hypothetical protein